MTAAVAARIRPQSRPFFDTEPQLIQLVGRHVLVVHRWVASSFFFPSHSDSELKQFTLHVFAHAVAHTHRANMASPAGSRAAAAAGHGSVAPPPLAPVPLPSGWRVALKGKGKGKVLRAGSTEPYRLPSSSIEGGSIGGDSSLEVSIVIDADMGIMERAELVANIIKLDVVGSQSCGYIHHSGFELEADNVAPSGASVDVWQHHVESIWSTTEAWRQVT